MFTEKRGWIATGILTPICLVILTWTLVIFHSNRRKWQSKDFIISTILAQCIIKQVATFLYTLIVLLKPIDYFETYCGCVKWVITSVDIFQAATLGTLIFTRLLAVRFPMKFRAIVKRSHINYHLITLGILSSCIGIASILAERTDDESLSKDNSKYCSFLPYDLNPKYAFLSIALNSLIALATIFALIWTIYSFFAKKRSISSSKSSSTLSTIRNSNSPRHVLMTSSSDVSQLSDMTLRSQYATRSTNLNKNPYRTHSSGRKHHAGRMFINFENSNAESTFQNGDNFSGNATLGNSSTDTLLSSRIVPNYHQLLNGPKPMSHISNYNEMYSSNPVNRWASESSYLSTSTSSTNSRAPCLTHPSARDENLALVTAGTLFLLCFVLTHLPFLIVTVVGTFMKNLLPSWPLNAYLLWAGLLQDSLLPIVMAAVDRNFKLWLRQMYTRQHKTPLAKHQGLDGKFRVFSTPLQSMQPIQLESHHSEPVKFPITNGSLFTSVDGRLPIIHNYRRGQGQRSNGHCINMGVPTALRRGDLNFRLQEENALQNCHHDCKLSMSNANSKLISGSFKDSHLSSNLRSFENCKITNSVRHRPNVDLFNQHMASNELMEDMRIGCFNLDHLRNSTLEHSDYDDIHLDLNEYESEPIYATLSSGSCCSATTAANDDFEFFQANNHPNNDTINGMILTSSFDVEKTKFISHDKQSIQHITESFPQLVQQQEHENQLSDQKAQHFHAIREKERMVEIVCQDDRKDFKQMEPNAVQGFIKNDEHYFDLNDNKASTNNLSLLDMTENVTKLDQYLQLVQLEHLNPKSAKFSGTCKPLTSYKKDIEMLVPMLESLNNFKHLHEYISPQTVDGKEFGTARHKSKENVSTTHGQQKLDLKTNNLMGLNTKTKAAYETYISTKHFPLEQQDESVEIYNPEHNENLNHRIYKKTQLNRRHLEPQLTKRLNRPPTNRRLLKPKRLEKTPPVSRRSLVPSQQVMSLRPETSAHFFQQNPIVPVLSVDSLTAALRNAGVSYLDNGDLWKHGREMSGSVPDFKKVFVSDFI